MTVATVALMFAKIPNILRDAIVRETAFLWIWTCVSSTNQLWRHCLLFSHCIVALFATIFLRYNWICIEMKWHACVHAFKNIQTELRSFEETKLWHIRHVSVWVQILRVGRRTVCMIKWLIASYCIALNWIVSLLNIFVNRLWLTLHFSCKHCLLNKVNGNRNKNTIDALSIRMFIIRSHCIHYIRTWNEWCKLLVQLR